MTPKMEADTTRYFKATTHSPKLIDYNFKTFGTKNIPSNISDNIESSISDHTRTTPKYMINQNHDNISGKSMDASDLTSVDGSTHITGTDQSSWTSSSSPLATTMTTSTQHDYTHYESTPSNFTPNNSTISETFKDHITDTAIENNTKSNIRTSLTSTDSILIDTRTQTAQREALNVTSIDTTETTSTNTATKTTVDYFENDNVLLSTKSTANYIKHSTVPHPWNRTDDNVTDFANIDTIINSFNSTTNETTTTPFQFFVPQQTTSSPFENYNNTNYNNYYHNGWREDANVTINESVLFISNSSVLFFPQYNHAGSNSFFNGISRIDSSPETIVKVFILALVSIFGSIGNFLVVGSVIKNRNLHRPPFYFLLSMGITDLARAGFCLPVVMATALQGSIWRHGDTACKMFAFAASFFVFSSTLSLLVISVERHLSIVHAKAYRRRCHGFINLFATIFIWVTAFLVSFPPIFASMGAGEYVFISEESQCTYDHKHFSHNDGLNSVLTFIGISLLTLFLYYRIFVFMRSHRRMRPLQHRPAFSSSWTFVGPGANGQAFINWLNGFGGNASNAYQRPAAAAAATVVGSGRNFDSIPSQPGHQRFTQRLNFGRVVNLCTTKNEHLTRLFFIMTLVHGATWLPYVILSLWRVFISSSNIPAGFITYAAWLSYSQVAICPLTYFLSRGKSKNTSRVIQMEPMERNEFLLENKIPK